MTDFNPIFELVEKELKRSNEIYKDVFHSRHESFGVLKEEFEEAKREMNDVETGIMCDYWKQVTRHNHDNPTDTIKLLNALQFGILNSINELIQVSAMIEKAKKLEKRSLKE